MFRALQIASERGFKDLKIRSDCNGMRRRLKLNYDRKRFPFDGGLERRILELAAEFDRVHFAYVPRRKNQRAHNLARRSRGLPPRTESWMPNDLYAGGVDDFPHMHSSWNLNSEPRTLFR